MTTESASQAQRTIDAQEFQAQCLALIDKVVETGEPITIVKDGRPVSRLVPCSVDAPKRNGPPFPSPLGRYKGLIKIAEDFDIVEGSALDDDWEEQMMKSWDELH